ncbi:MAG: insulinase family protein [Paramuribaculum sp.]|nr:insulinase family protein [Paramuribaculum sp.]
MKRLSLFTGLFLALLTLLPFGVQAQMMPALPTDSEVRIGKLPNGLTYYIRHNEYPKGQADFYIAQKVGSMQEEDDQRGLAHFLEHMCFNGTTNFPGKNLINWLESVGVKFGVNLNAYTSFDETVYNINNVPIAREGVQDSCLLILHDWANDLLLLPEEIDAERAVIHEEWRRSNVGQMRILETALPTMFPGDKYGNRLPIGTMEVVDNFPHQVLRDYYEKWYRPDLQGIIVVGDIDVDRIEAKIKEMFSDIEMPANPAERVYFPVNDNKGTIYAIGHDSEQQNAIVELFIKTDAFPDSLKNTAAYFMQEYVQSMISSMLNSRLNDISSKPDAPFAGAEVAFGEFFVAKTKDALTLVALAKDGNLPSALAATYRELLRALRGGFTPGEYERAKSEYLSRYERQYNNRNQRENNSFVQEYVRNFLDKEPIPGLEVEWQMVQMIANSVPVALINQVMGEIETSDNRVLLAMLPDNAEGKYPSENDFAEALAAVDGEEIEAYVDEVKAEPLIPQLPKPGKITKTVEDKQWDATMWTLSNGATVIVKQTKFKDDEILFNAVANGGYSKFGDEYANSLLFMNTALQQSGLGDYTNMDLQKYLAGKQAGVRLSWSPFSRTVAGNTVPKDLPTLMELIYMNFTAVNFTPDEFEAMQKTTASILHNQEADPQFAYNQKLLTSLYGVSPRNAMPTVATVEGAKREEIIEISRAMTGNAADWTFIFVGNIDLDVLKPLVEQYIASLPGNEKTAVKKVTEFDPAFKLRSGKINDTYKIKMQTPQTYAFIADWADMPYTMKDYQLASIAGQILSKRLIDIVREKEGAVYSISAYGAMGSSNEPNNTIIQTMFPMKPEMKDKVVDIIAGQFQDMTENISPEELAKVKEYMVKSYTEGKEKNNAWLGAIGSWKRSGVDTFNGNIDSVNSITVDDVKNFMKNLLGQGNYIVVIGDPE